MPQMRASRSGSSLARRPAANASKKRGGLEDLEPQLHHALALDDQVQGPLALDARQGAYLDAAALAHPSASSASASSRNFRRQPFTWRSRWTTSRRGTPEASSCRAQAAALGSALGPKQA